MDHNLESLGYIFQVFFRVSSKTQSVNGHRLLSFQELSLSFLRCLKTILRVKLLTNNFCIALTKGSAKS